MTTTSLDRPQTNAAKRNVMVGIFVLLGLAILAGGILAVGNIHSTFIPKIRVSTSFPDVNGLQPGNNVWFSGLKVGTVDELEFVGESQVARLAQDRQGHPALRAQGRDGQALERRTHRQQDCRDHERHAGTRASKTATCSRPRPSSSTDDMLVDAPGEQDHDLRAPASRSRVDHPSRNRVGASGPMGRACSCSSTTTRWRTASRRRPPRSRRRRRTARTRPRPPSPTTPAPSTSRAPCCTISRTTRVCTRRSTKTSAGLAAASEDAARPRRRTPSGDDGSNSPAGALLADEAAAADSQATFANLGTSLGEARRGPRGGAAQRPLLSAALREEGEGGRKGCQEAEKRRHSAGGAAPQELRTESAERRRRAGWAIPRNWVSRLQLATSPSRPGTGKTALSSARPESLPAGLPPQP